MLSRVASSLYWMSRYVERAENTARVLDVAWRMSLLVKEPPLQDQEWFPPLNITGTMHRDDAYEFARLGTHMERADSTARILDVKYHILLPSVKDVGGAVDYYQWSAILRSVAAFEAYRKVYRDVITPLKLAELLIVRDDIPRSLRFCLRQAFETLGHVQNAQSEETLRRAGQVLAGLQYGRISEIFAGGLHEYLTEFLESMQDLSAQIQKSFFSSSLVE